jgi:hypothetical protein
MQTALLHTRKDGALPGSARIRQATQNGIWYAEQIEPRTCWTRPAFHCIL